MIATYLGGPRTAFGKQLRFYLDAQVSETQLNHSQAIALWRGESINALIGFLLPRRRWARDGNVKRAKERNKYLRDNWFPKINIKLWWQVRSFVSDRGALLNEHFITHELQVKSFVVFSEMYHSSEGLMLKKHQRCSKICATKAFLERSSFQSSTEIIRKKIFFILT